MSTDIKPITQDALLDFHVGRREGDGRRSLRVLSHERDIPLTRLRAGNDGRRVRVSDRLHRNSEAFGQAAAQIDGNALVLAGRRITVPVQRPGKEGDAQRAAWRERLASLLDACRRRRRARS